MFDHLFTAQLKIELGRLKFLSLAVFWPSHCLYVMVLTPWWLACFAYVRSSTERAEAWYSDVPSTRTLRMITALFMGDGTRCRGFSVGKALTKITSCSAHVHASMPSLSLSHTHTLAFKYARAHTHTLSLSLSPSYLSYVISLVLTHRYSSLLLFLHTNTLTLLDTRYLSLTLTVRAIRGSKRNS